ncbi:RNA polymerase sigma factor sigB-like [Canna indica]|uniref:RNA polymerase sigma factor n=1 Tax=Canna indica TaxID=4628 RepID=A0AAQ3KQJ6_9LILI|nr:RNA polymerase sigma factor sigB-like [Canna indica]
MACLAPQFKCPSSLNSLHPKARDPVCSRIQCVLSPPTSVIEIERLPMLEANSTNSVRPLKYSAAVGPPIKGTIATAFAAETLLKGEEAVIAAAAAEAVALARAAVEVAKGAAQTIGKNPFPETYNIGPSPSEADKHQVESDRAIGTKWISHSHITEPLEDNSTKNPYDNTDITSLMDSELDNQEISYSKSIAVKSGRQTERRARRVRAVEKAAAGVIPVKSATSGKKKRNSLQEIDYADPLRYLRGTTSTSKLLSATEELQLSEGIQDLLKLERLHVELVERNGEEPTLAQWAAAAGVDKKTLRKRLNYGKFCKDKMIKSNIRLVISIAKNYQNAGLSLQDLVQEGCRGLVKGAEKFDASKGFKFSTYAHWWIKQAVRRSLSEQSRTIRLPFHMVEATYRVREAKRQIYSETRRHPDNEEVAEMTGLSMKRLETVLLIRKAPISLDQKIGIHQNLKPSEVIADPEAETSEDILIKQLMKEDLNKVLNSLSPREKQVMQLRFGLENGVMRSLQEIGDMMGVSRERIRQIESSAFRKLKSKRKMRNLQQYLIS